MNKKEKALGKKTRNDLKKSCNFESVDSKLKKTRFVKQEQLLWISEGNIRGKENPRYSSKKDFQTFTGIFKV